MGMYTGLRVDVTLHERFVPLIEEVMRGFEDEELNDSEPWERAAAKFPEFKWVEEWSHVGRCNFIPFGALAYMPWEDLDPYWGERRLTADRRWIFQCSLKNYSYEIQEFLDCVLSRITEKTHEVYYLYEEDDKPTHWEGINITR